MQLIQKELVQLEGVPCSCVLHIGKVGTLETVCQHLNDLHITRSEFERSPYPLLMECSAGQGTELGKNWPELRKLFEGIDTNKIGLCMDTQHAFAAGLSDFGSHESVVKFFEEAESIAPGGVSLIHLNDSKVEFGRRVDRHANIGQGHIWSGKEKEEGLQSLIQYCFEKGIDMILETPNEGVESDLSILRSLDM
jgi:deoxyribonuclease-4